MDNVDILTDCNIFNIEYKIDSYPEIFYFNLTSYLFNNKIFCFITSKNSFCVSTNLELKDIIPIINNISSKLNMSIKSINKI